MLAEHRLGWREVLTALETIALVGVTPVSVEIAASEGSGLARVEVAFSDHARLLEYLERLNAGQADPQWTLIRAQAQAGGSSTAVLQARASVDKGCSRPSAHVQSSTWIFPSLT